MTTPPEDNARYLKATGSAILGQPRLSMNSTPCFPFSNFGRRSRAVFVALVGLFSSALASEASKLFIYSAPGGPMEYNTLGAVWTDTGWVTMLSISFEVPVALRIQAIKVWMNGGPESTATFSVYPANPGPESGPPFSRTFSVEEVDGAPAKWQGLSSLKWDLKPGVHELFISAPDVPLGYGYQGPTPNLDSLLNTLDYKDYSQPDNIPWAPFGLEVYGSLSPVPEPSFYGAVGSVGLLALAASRRFKRKGRAETVAVRPQ